tara:strand:+ start:5124 stop:6242 length:1119 start_codon:yes stop_codon:yes gene_type:complete
VLSQLSYSPILFKKDVFYNIKGFNILIFLILSNNLLMKILHLADIDSIEKPGGIEAVISNIKNYFSPKTIDHQIIYRGELSGWNFIGKAVPSKNKLYAEIDRLKPDKIMLYGSTPFIWITIFLLKLKRISAKIFIIPFYHEPKSTKSPLLAAINFFFLNMVIAKNIGIGFCTNFERQKFYFLEEKNYVIQHPFFLIENNNLDEKKENYLFVGRDDTHKGLDLFFEVAEMYPEQNFVAITVPKKNRKVLRNMSILSNLSNANLKLEYAKARILIFPSAYESYGGVLLEALSSQCLVIASSGVKGVEYFTNNENVFAYKHAKDSKKNVLSIKENIDLIKKNNLTFKHYNKNYDIYNEISTDKHIQSIGKLLDLI